MTTKIELPEEFRSGNSVPVERATIKRERMIEILQATIEADRKQQGEVVVTKTPEGEIIAVTRQDDEGRILSVIAEADRQRVGKRLYTITTICECRRSAKAVAESEKEL